ncbi:DUF885 domain-containing protein [Pedosphaera parvula]|uniref:DUF885 domain-containing protein n=1 Tax=Pedosphaera parvula (strain Ellin514) TaxID=320771 RepID=B9XJ06_PEDPL|nr:DUF885 domain-containing protein [Pedosphaera parvula]EEF60233.1 protein of unknown function DUF885 [Pedosphaera parvula Ellin514]
MHRVLLSIIALVLGCSSLKAQTNTSYSELCQSLIENKSHKADTERIQELYQIHWEYLMHEYPEWATYVGYPGQNDRWTDNSLKAIEHRKKLLQIPLKALQSIDRTKLDQANQLNYDLLKERIKHEIEGTRFKGEYLAINQLGGVQQDVPQLLEVMPRKTVKDYENILTRLKGVPTVVNQTMVLLKKGLESKITEPRITLRDVPDQIQSQMVAEPLKNPILLAFTSFPADVPKADQDRLLAEAGMMLTNQIIPAFAELKKFMVDSYIPGARETVGLSDLPDGSAWYQMNIRNITTTSLTPEQIHQIGLSEVKRIHKEMETVMKESGFKGGLDEFFVYLRTDPKFYFDDAESLLSAYRDIAKRADPELCKIIGKLPRLTYGVTPVPSYSEKSQTTAYYQPGSPKAHRPGYFYANTYDLKTRPKWEMEPLSLHESVPGHHIQLALAQEMENVPELRKEESYTAFVEGWGLYAESLGGEMGFYKDPYAKFGRLTYEMWRAIRLVVDTGMHAKGWSRQQAIDYFKANASKNEHDITVEVDRYIVWPGQALAYKIGELKIKELRAYSKKELGDKFDIRSFHDEVLDNGALPLNVLEKHIKEWVATQKVEGKSVASGK